jgi:hypothetical protein
MREWLRKVLVGTDGNPSISNVILISGLLAPLLLGAVFVILCAFGKLQWSAVAGGMEWIKDFTVLALLPYLFKKLAYAVGISI